MARLNLCRYRQTPRQRLEMCGITPVRNCHAVCGDFCPCLITDLAIPGHYYYCAATGEAQWTKPSGPSKTNLPSAESVVLFDCDSDCMLPDVTLDGLSTTQANNRDNFAWVTITMEETGGAQALRQFLMTKCEVISNHTYVLARLQNR